MCALKFCRSPTFVKGIERSSRNLKIDIDNFTVASSQWRIYTQRERERERMNRHNNVALIITRDRDRRTIDTRYLLPAKMMITVPSNYTRVQAGCEFRGKRQVIGLTGRK